MIEEQELRLWVCENCKYCTPVTLPDWMISGAICSNCKGELVVKRGDEAREIVETPTWKKLS